MSYTFASNFTLLASVAYSIVAEPAQLYGAIIDFIEKVKKEYSDYNYYIFLDSIDTIFTLK